MSAVLPPLPDYPAEVDRSAKAIAAELRILADLIEASPDFPVRSHGLSVGQALNSEAEVRRVGEILGLHVSEDSRPDGSRAWRVDRPGALYMAWSYLEDAPETSPVQTAADSAAGQEAGDGVIDPSSPAAPDVWVAVRRRGINYHLIDTGGRYTVCGRAVRPAGVRLTLFDATALAQVPCPACHTKPLGRRPAAHADAEG